MNVTNKEELAYVMDFYHIREFPIFDESRGSYACGYIVRNKNHKDGVEYSTKRSAYHFTNEAVAFIRGFKQINDVVDVIEKSAKNTSATVIYKKDRLEEEQIWEGTFDQLCERIEEENRHLRYCNGYYYSFKEEKIKKMYIIWYSLISEGRKFNLYYGGGIVD